MKYIRSEKYDKKFLKENIMGPNPIKLLEELVSYHPISSDDTVLDLGCGRGVTSVFLAKEFKPMVFAADLWIAPTENKRRFDEMGLTSRQVIPIKAEAHELPFAEEFFDVVTCVDSYNFFGLDKEYLGKYLLPFIKHGGYLLISVPGLKKDIHDNIPEEMRLSWSAEDIGTLHDIAYWRHILEAAEGAEIVAMNEMQGFDECWDEWLSCENEYAVHDRMAMEAGAGKYMNFIAMILRRK